MKEKGMHNIVGIHITNRVKNVPSVQTVLTDFGCHIKTRLGLHDLSENYCSPNGLLLIELAGDDSKREAFITALKAIEGIDVQSMVFTH